MQTASEVRGPSCDGSGNVLIQSGRPGSNRQRPAWECASGRLRELWRVQEPRDLVNAELPRFLFALATCRGLSCVHVMRRSWETLWVSGTVFTPSVGPLPRPSRRKAASAACRNPSAGSESRPGATRPDGRIRRYTSRDTGDSPARWGGLKAAPIDGGSADRPLPN